MIKTVADMGTRSITGARVLIVEDEELISMMLSDMLETLGATAIGPFASLREAEPVAAAGAFDVAILDVHVGGQEVFPLADRLRAAGMPYVIASGSAGDTLPPAHRDAVQLPKPYALPALEAALNAALATAR